MLREHGRTSSEGIALALLLAAFAVVLVRSAWLCDDAYITFRTVDNFVNGHGLRFNVAERVQAYTHPLWMLLLSLSAALTGDFEIAPLLLSILLSLATLAILALYIAPDRSSAIVAVAVLSLSKTFVDYSTSGLENPLSHLLLALFALVYLGSERGRHGDATKIGDDRRLLLCFGIAGLAALNRLDAALLYAPALASELLAARSRRALGLATLGLTPMLLWLVFALIYYGNPLPNTAYAKLGAGIPPSSLLLQGLLYLRASFALDPITPVAILAGCGCAAWKRDRGVALALGVLLYLLYVVRIGGDFMAGRHLALPLLASVILLSRSLPHWAAAPPIAFACAVALGLAGPHPPFLGDAWIQRGEPIFERYGVKDERSVYAPYTAPFGRFPMRRHPWAEQGRKLGLRGPSVLPKTAIGLFAFHAGPRVFVVDANALADPLLARLPARERGEGGWRVGHHTRDLPDGYLETLRSGRNQIVDPGIAALYASIERVTRGEIWSTGRLREIGRLLSGHFDAAVESYAADAGLEPDADP